MNNHVICVEEYRLSGNIQNLCQHFLQYFGILLFSSTLIKIIAQL